MFPYYSLLATLVLALVVTANPVVIRDSPVTLPLVRRLNANGTAFNLLARDQARVSGLRSFAQRKLTGTLSEAATLASIPATNQAVDYVVSVSWLPLTSAYSRTHFF